MAQTKSGKKLEIRLGIADDFNLLRPWITHLEQAVCWNHQFTYEHTNRLLLAFVEGQLAGRVRMDLHPEHPVKFKEIAGVVDDLFTEPAFRNDGVASALLDSAEALAIAEGKTVAEIGVSRNNVEPLVLRHSDYDWFNP